MDINQCKYLPFDSTTPSVRCISQVSIRSDGEIALSLERLPISEAAGNYTGVSYVWGGNEPSHKVRIEGEYLLVQTDIRQFMPAAAIAPFSGLLVQADSGLIQYASTKSIYRRKTNKSGS